MLQVFYEIVSKEPGVDLRRVWVRLKEFRWLSAVLIKSLVSYVL